MSRKRNLSVKPETIVKLIDDGMSFGRIGLKYKVSPYIIINSLSEVLTTKEVEELILISSSSVLNRFKFNQIIELHKVGRNISVINNITGVSVHKIKEVLDIFSDEKWHKRIQTASKYSKAEKFIKQINNGKNISYIARRHRLTSPQIINIISKEVTLKQLKELKIISSSPALNREKFDEIVLLAKKSNKIGRISKLVGVTSYKVKQIVELFNDEEWYGHAQAMARNSNYKSKTKENKIGNIDRDKEILRLATEDKLTCTEIGEMYGCTRANISKILIEQGLRRQINIKYTKEDKSFFRKKFFKEGLTLSMIWEAWKSPNKTKQKFTEANKRKIISFLIRSYGKKAYHLQFEKNEYIHNKRLTKFQKLLVLKIFNSGITHPLLIRQEIKTSYAHYFYHDIDENKLRASIHSLLTIKGLYKPSTSKIERDARLSESVKLRWKLTPFWEKMSTLDYDKALNIIRALNAKRAKKRKMKNGHYFSIMKKKLDDVHPDANKTKELV